MITVNHALIRVWRTTARRAPVALRPGLAQLGSMLLPDLAPVLNYCGKAPLPPGLAGDGMLVPLPDVELPGLVAVLLLEPGGELLLEPGLPPAAPAAPVPPEAPLEETAGLLLALDFFLVEPCFLLLCAGVLAESEGMVVWACASCCARCSTAAIFWGSVLSIITLLAPCANDAADRVQSEAKMARDSLFIVGS